MVKWRKEKNRIMVKWRKEKNRIMKTIKRYLALVVIVNTMVLSACGGIASQGNGEPQRSEQSLEEDSGQIYDSTVSDITASVDATPQVDQSDTNNTSDNKDDIGSYNGTNATSQINSILSQAAGDYGSFKLVDYGNGTYALVDINYTYQQRVGESPNYTWVENGFQGQSSLFGDGLGAEDMGDGVFVEVNLTLEREYRVVINKDGAIAFYGVDGGGMDFPRIDY